MLQGAYIQCTNGHCYGCMPSTTRILFHLVGFAPLEVRGPMALFAMAYHEMIWAHSVGAC